MCTGDYDTQLRLKEMIKLLILFRQRDDKCARNCQDKEKLVRIGKESKEGLGLASK